MLFGEKLSQFASFFLRINVWRDMMGQKEGA